MQALQQGMSFNIIGETAVFENDVTRLATSLGCNGRNHAELIVREFLAYPGGGVVSAEIVGSEILSLCDHTCANKLHNSIGQFVLDA